MSWVAVTACPYSNLHSGPDVIKRFSYSTHLFRRGYLLAIWLDTVYVMLLEMSVVNL